MDSSLAASEPSVKPTLVYPFEGPPPRGETLEVAPGVHWIRMPLPFALNHINLWAIDDGDGWTIVDTGVRNDETTETWRQLFSLAVDGRRINRVIVTHMHPDHVGMAGWLTRKFDCRLWMTRLEYLSCRTLVADTGREAPADALAFYRRAGWSAAALESYGARFGNFGKLIYTLPDSYRRIEDGETLTIGGRAWRVIVGSGHSPEHACLYCPELEVLISGDQILPRISSNVSVYPTEPEANPMAEWLASLAKLKREVPAGVLVLPAHNECFRGLHDRIDHLARGQGDGDGAAAPRARRAEARDRCLRRVVRAGDRPGQRGAARHGDGREPGLPEPPGACGRGALRAGRRRRGLVPPGGLMWPRLPA